jgi:hypothetical protein
MRPCASIILHFNLKSQRIPNSFITPQYPSCNSWKLKLPHMDVSICRNPSLGFMTKARVCKGAGQEWAQESHCMLLGVQESGREWTCTLPNELPLWELESQWTPEYLESDYRDQNPWDWDVPYIIGKILEHNYLKWAHMTHLDTQNTSYGQKKGWESNWQFNSQPLKVKNRLDLLACR